MRTKCRPHRADRTHRRRGRSDRHPFARDPARCTPRCRYATAKRDGRRNPDPVGTDTAAPCRAGDHDADRWHRSICDSETRCAADQTADQGAPLQHRTRRQRQLAVCRTGQAGGCEPVLLHAARPPQLSRPGHRPGDPRRASAARFDPDKLPGALTSTACLARATVRARLCLSPI